MSVSPHGSRPSSSLSRSGMGSRLSKLPGAVQDQLLADEEVARANMFSENKSAVVISYGIKPNADIIDPNNIPAEMLELNAHLMPAARKIPVGSQVTKLGFGSRTKRFTATDYSVGDPKLAAETQTFAGPFKKWLHPDGGAYETGVAHNLNMVRPQKLHVSALRGLPHIFQASTGRLVTQGLDGTLRPMLGSPGGGGSPFSNSLGGGYRSHSSMSTRSSKRHSGRSTAPLYRSTPISALSTPNAEARGKLSPRSLTSADRSEVPWSSKNLDGSLSPSRLRRPVPGSRSKLAPEVEFPSLEWFQATGIEDIQRVVATPGTSRAAAQAAEKAAWYPNPVPRLWAGTPTPRAQRERGASTPGSPDKPQA